MTLKYFAILLHFQRHIFRNFILILRFRCSRQFHYIWMRSHGAPAQMEHLAWWRAGWWWGGWSTWGGRGRDCGSSWRRASGGREGRRRRRGMSPGLARWRRLDLTPCSHDIKLQWMGKPRMALRNFELKGKVNKTQMGWNWEWNKHKTRCLFRIAFSLKRCRQ